MASTDLDAVAGDELPATGAEADGRGAAIRRAGISVGRVGRRRIRRSTVRRARHAVAGMLHRAEDWLRSNELEADRL